MTKLLNQIICGDCLEVMTDIPDNHIDLTVTSPPYDNLRDYKRYDFNFKGIANELYRIIKEGGVVVWVVGDATIKGSETGTSFRQALYFKEIGFRLHDTMIYEKAGTSFPSINRYYQQFEYMFVFSKGKPKVANLLTKKNIWGGTETFGNPSNRNREGDLISHKKRKIKEFGVKSNIWRYQAGLFGTKDKGFEHPAPFPEKLAQDHIISWSNKGDIVLDPMCGSGTTCKMAKILGRRYIGIDISKEYCNLSRRKINATPEPLFSLNKNKKR